MKRPILCVALLLSALAARADDAEDCGKSPNPVAACTRVIESGSLHGARLARAYAKRAMAKLRTRELAAAIADYTSAIGLDPQHSDNYGDRGVVRSVMHDFDGAIADFNREIELESQQPGRQQAERLATAHYNRANAKGGKGDREGAIADYTRAIELNPKYGEAYDMRGTSRWVMGDRVGALADLDHAIQLDPESSSPYLKRGAVKADQGDLAGALVDLNRAVELDPQDFRNYVFRGLLKGKQGDADGALADAERIVELAPQAPEGYIGRGLAKKDKGDFEGAIASYSHAIELAPQRALGYSLRGSARRNHGDFDAAIADFNRAMELEPHSYVHVTDRAVALFMKGEPALAADDLARSYQLRPEAHTALWLYLARTRAKAEGEKELAANTARFDNQEWPAPIVALYLGHATPKQLLAAANNQDARTEQVHVCEANFYLAEWHLLKDDRKAALPLLREAAAHCPREFVEPSVAAVELRRLEAR